MRGGRLHILGDAGAYAGSRLAGGHLEIDGDAGDRLCGPLAGEMAGMSGGVVIVHGDAGARAGRQAAARPGGDRRAKRKRCG